jgi:hypothetical protein
MTTAAAGTFKVGSWDEATYQELAGDAKLTRATITMDYLGEVEGKGSSELLMCYRADGTATYVGFELVTGSVRGKRGTFVAECRGSFDGAQSKTLWSVVPESATDELQGLCGEGTLVAGHEPPGSLTFDFQIP